MAYREVTMLEVKEVLRLWLAGRPEEADRRAARLRREDGAAVPRRREGAGRRAGHGLGALDDELVAAVVAATQPATGGRAATAGRSARRTATFIERHLDERRAAHEGPQAAARGRASRSSYPTLRRFALAELGFGRGAPTMPVADCEPGEEVQVDTGWMTLLAPDAARASAGASAPGSSRPSSRAIASSTRCFQETTETAIEACEAAWEFFGGVFGVLIPDNTKAIVDDGRPARAADHRRLPASTRRRAASTSTPPACATRRTRPASSARCRPCATTASAASGC